ncbi:MAG: hypothetical protein FJZ01_06030 [Candidatus Sericytochromatia bacterium]|nr:hypothetical protein [Candidatus Tanganyikabacteria bacterium]
MGPNAVGQKPAVTISAASPVLKAAPALSLGQDTFVSSTDRDPLQLGTRGPRPGGGMGKMILGGLLGSVGAAGVGAWLLDIVGGGGLLASLASAVGMLSLPAWLPIVSIALLAGGAALAYWGHKDRVDEESVRLALPGQPRTSW